MNIRHEISKLTGVVSHSALAELEMLARRTTVRPLESLKPVALAWAVADAERLYLEELEAEDRDDWRKMEFAA